MQPILELQSISKKFVIDHENKHYLSLRDSLANIFKPKMTHEDFWALKDISFDVEHGDTVGIIGKNGAGKSTLLKILSKITPPTNGKIISRGRIASLLEVGTGFHPELSGRENVFMNGSILGMKRTEIAKNFDAIVEFAGVSKFIDTPLKHYSSGMQLRLAFAVAAFLENEVLIIDEVLAVGDMDFQKKCMNKMGDISKSGRTILFVSHQLGAVSKLCNKSILLQKGKLVLQSSTEKVIDEYLKTDNLNLNYLNENNSVNKSIYFNRIETANARGENINEFTHQDPILVKLKIHVNELIRGAHICIALLDNNKSRVFSAIKNLEEIKNNIQNNKLNVVFKIPGNIIAPNNYSFLAAIYFPEGSSVDWLEDICPISIIDHGTEFSAYKNFGNVILHDCEWTN